ncbi:MAG TPA: efflux RND transporter periplasmic adaptor subunit [Polyangiaceae bacterium]|nr:efflux RND transporter periplasmic adaptor subunit [Polyangiaceae bacterium]
MRGKYLLAVGSSLAFGVALALTWQHVGTNARAASPARASAPAELPVDVYPVVSEPLEMLIPANGTLLARESVQLVSGIERRLAKVRVAEGRSVKRGDVLFELDSTDLRAQLRKTRVQERLARSTLTRARSLNSEGITNRQDLDVAQARVEELAAERQVLEVELGKTLIRAPFSGTLGLRRVSAGAWLSPNTVLAVLHDTTSLKLDFNLPERYGAELARGDTFRFHVEGAATAFDGIIDAIEPSIDVVTRSVPIRGVVTAAAGLRPGSSASIEVPIRVDQTVLVPAIAVLPGIDGRNVFVARGGVAHSVPVEVGFRTEDRVQLSSGVQPGDQVIVSNLLQLRDGLPVRVSAMAGQR